MTVVILVQRQDDKTAAGKLDGIGILHFGRVQVTVGDDDRRLRVIGRSVFRHIEQAAELTVPAVKADAADRDSPVSGVEHTGQNAAEQDQC